MRSRHALVLALVLSVSLAACSDDAGETVEDLSLIHISEPTRPY